MTAPLTTPSPYLRDGLLTVVNDLREHAQAASQAYEDAAAERNRLARELADAEDYANARAAELESIAESIRWAENRAAELSRMIDPPPHERLAEVGLTREEPKPVPRADDLPGMREEADFLGGETDMDAPPVARTPDQVHAALSGTAPYGALYGQRVTVHWIDGDRTTGTLTHSDSDALYLRDVHGVDHDVPLQLVQHVNPWPDPGQPVATHGPTTTMPDLGPARPPLDPPPGDGTHSHARPSDGLMSRVTGGFRALIHRDDDEQDGNHDG